jgi:hypothetical protein
MIGRPENRIRNFIFKSDPEHQHGKKLIHWPDLVAFVSRQAEAAQQAAKELERALE